MKKVLVTAAALGLVAGMATGASALELKVKGTYKVDGYYFSSGNGIVSGGGVGLVDMDKFGDFLYYYTGVSVPGNDNEAWWQHKFQLKPTLVINDKVSIKSDIRLIASDTIWGKQDDTTTRVGEGASNNLDISKIWLVYESPVGRWEIGRRPAGSWEGDFVNSGTKADRVMWKSGKLFGDNFSMYAFLQKTEEVDAYYNSIALYAGDDLLYADRLYTANADNDYYEVAAKYKTDQFMATLAYGYWKDETKKDDYRSEDNWDADTGWGGAAGAKKTGNRIKGYGTFNIGDSFGISGEFDYKWGDIDKTFYGGKTSSVDFSAWAYMLGLDMNFGNLSSTFAYAHIDGDNDNDPELNAYSPSKGMGADFEPLYILTGYWANILNGDKGANLFGSMARQSGADLIYFVTDYKVSDDLTVHGGIGYAKADDAPAHFDDEYGWELDAGLAYRLYDNLVYEMRLGYLATGDFFKLDQRYSDLLNIDTEEIWMASHHLTMSF